MELLAGKYPAIQKAALLAHGGVAMGSGGLNGDVSVKTEFKAAALFLEAKLAKAKHL